MLEPHSENVSAAGFEAGDTGDPPFRDAVEDFKDAAPESGLPAPIKLTSDGSPTEASTPDWREELAAKMQDYRTRRKPRGPKYPSLQLPFEMAYERLEPFRSVPAEAASRSSLALDHLAIDHSRDASLRESHAESVPQLVREINVPEHKESVSTMQAVAPATNLIEFPRYPTAQERDELAEPLIEYPRILDAPESVPAQPALGGILLEEQQNTNLRTDAALDLHPASVGRRFVAAILDALFVASATALWGWIFLKLTHVVPPQQQLLIAGALIPAVLWMGYQYLLLVGAGTTLGLRVCRMELVSFDGSVPPKAKRRWRLLASVLSAASLMLGYAWVLLDENSLCWHDRITRTYLRARKS